MVRGSCAPIVVLERTPKYQTPNTLNIECPNIELSEHHILAQNRTSNMSNMLNITKNRTVGEHRTVHSKTNFYLPKYCTYELYIKYIQFPSKNIMAIACVFIDSFQFGMKWIIQ